jgi:O-Antigen ligase.
LTLIYFVFAINNCPITKNTFINLFILILILVLAFISVFIVSSELNFDYFKKYLIFCTTIIFIFNLNITDSGKKLTEFILKFNFVFFIMYFLCYLFGNSPYYAGGITLNFSNPNLLAYWLLLMSMYLVLCFIYFNKIIIKIITLILISITVILIFQTKTRSALLALLIFGLLIFTITINKKFKFGKILNLLLLLYPLIFSVIYYFNIHNKIIVEMFDSLTSPGKDLDSRYEAWNNSFNIIKNNLLFGNYYTISNGTGRSQLLNIHIDVIGSYGIIVFSLFIFLIYRITNQITENSNTKFQKVAIACFFTAIIMGTSEAAIVSGGNGIFILACSFLLISKYISPIEEKKCQLA